MALVYTRSIDLLGCEYFALSPCGEKIFYIAKHDELMEYDLYTDEYTKYDGDTGDLMRPVAMVCHPTNRRIYVISGGCCSILVRHDDHRVTVQNRIRLHGFGSIPCYASTDESGSIDVVVFGADLTVFKLLEDGTIHRRFNLMLGCNLAYNSRIRGCFIDPRGNVLWKQDKLPGLQFCDASKREISTVMPQINCQKLHMLSNTQFCTVDINNLMTIYNDRLERVSTVVFPTRMYGRLYATKHGFFYNTPASSIAVFKVYKQWETSIHSAIRFDARHAANRFVEVWWNCCHHTGGVLSLIPIELVFEIINAMWYADLFWKSSWQKS